MTHLDSRQVVQFLLDGKWVVGTVVKQSTDFPHLYIVETREGNTFYIDPSTVKV